MTEATRLHQEAMTLAEQAFIAQQRGLAEEAEAILAKALERESEAAHTLDKNGQIEPSRSILFRSAASIAFQCSKYREAEQLIAEALTGNPPDEIADELRELWDDVQFYRHARLNGIELDHNQVQLSMSGGNSVGHGIASESVFQDRLSYFRSLIVRTVERLIGSPYRSGGRPKRAIQNRYRLFLSVPRAQSFAVTLHVGKSQLSLSDTSNPQNVVDEVLDDIQTLNADGEEALREKIDDYRYHSNFVALVRKIAPDGKQVRNVSLSSVRGGEHRILRLKQRDQIRPPPPRDDNERGEPVEIVGELRFADALKSKKQDQIRIVDYKGKTHNIFVPSNLTTDIVQPLWESIVVIYGIRKRDRITLVDIERAE